MAEIDHSSSNSNRPHILVFVHPIPGRLIPAMQLASRIQASGGANLQVSFAFPDFATARLAEVKSRMSESSSAGKINLVELKLDQEEGEANEPELLRDFRLMPQVVRSLERFIAQLPAKLACLISDEISGGVSKLASKLKIRCYTFVPQSGFAFSAALFAVKLAQDDRLPLPAKSSEELVEIPSVATLAAPQYLSVYHDLMPEWLRNYFVDAAAQDQKSDGFLINTFERLESKILSALRREKSLNPNQVPVLPIGPLVALDHQSLDKCYQDDATTKLCIEFLDRHPPDSVVFVAFGSLKKCSDEETDEILEGLKASGHPFIWVARSSTGRVPEIDQEQALIVSDWAPQLQILSHRSTGLFLSHCGWNSTLESLSHGVPVLAFPCFMDQHINCKLLTEFNHVGLKLPALEGTLIAAVVKKIMGSAEIRLASQELKRATEEAITATKHSLKMFVAGLT